jgi:hypothetical protein
MAVRDIKAGRAYVEMYLKDVLAPGLKKAAKRLTAFGRAVNKLGAGLIAGGAALAVPLAAGVQTFTDWGDELAKMSDRTGISVASLSELTHAALQSGASIEELENAVKLLQKNLWTAAAGGKAQAAAFARIGLSVADLVALDPERQFLAVADALAKIDDPARRAAAAQQILGRSGTRLLPLLKDGVAGIAALREEARQLGLTMSDADAQLAVRLGDQLANVWRQVKMVAFQVGAALTPALLTVARVVQPVLAGVIALVREHRVAVTVVALLAGALAATGGLLVAFGSTCVLVAFALNGLSAAAGVCAAVMAGLGTVVAFVTSPITLTVAGVLALVAAIGLLIGWATGLNGTLLNLASTGLAAIGRLLGGMADAAMGGDLKLAGEILWAGLKLAWLNGFAALMEIGLRFKLGFLAMWNGLLDEIEKLFIRSAAAIARGWELTKSLFTGANPAAALDRIDEHEQTLLQGVDQAAIGRAAAQLAELRASRTASLVEIAAAQAELDALLKRAAEARAKFATPFSFEPGQIDLPDFKTVTDRLAVGGPGAFNAAAAANLGRTASIEEKMLSALEGIEQDADELARAARGGGLVFV